MCCHKSPSTYFFSNRKVFTLGGIKYLVRVRVSEREKDAIFFSSYNFSLTQTRNPNCQTQVKKEEAGRQAVEHGPRSQGLKSLLFEEFRVYVTDTCGSGGLPTILGGLGSSPTIIILRQVPNLTTLVRLGQPSIHCTALGSFN